MVTPARQLARRAAAADCGLQRWKDPPRSVSQIAPSGVFLRVQLLDNAERHNQPHLRMSEHLGPGNPVRRQILEQDVRIENGQMPRGRS
jgi:hypothetical protein